jgi:hypothetical protein
VQQAESSASHQRSELGQAGAPSAHGPNPPPSRHQDRGEGAELQSRASSGPTMTQVHTIKAHRRAGSDDRGHTRHYDSEDDRDRSCSPNQRGPRTFSQNVRDARFPSRFQALRNVPRYNGDTNASVCLEDYRLSCHTGGATDNLFVIKNMPLYLGDSAWTWLEHLPRDKINSWTNLHWVFVGNFQGTYTRPGKKWELRNCKQQPGESLREYVRRFSKRCTELPGTTDNDDQRSRMTRPAPLSSTDSDVARLVQPRSSSTSRATTRTTRKRSQQRSTPLKPRGSRSWTTARGRPRASRKRRRRTTSVVATTTWLQWSNARRRAPRATGPSPIHQRTTSRSS